MLNINIKVNINILIYMVLHNCINCKKKYCSSCSSSGSSSGSSSYSLQCTDICQKTPGHTIYLHTIGHEWSHYLCERSLCGKCYLLTDNNLCNINCDIYATISKSHTQWHCSTGHKLN
jgi:hypothetical protein